MRVVIADDSALLREGLARLLTEAGVEVCAKVARRGGTHRGGRGVPARHRGGRHPDAADVHPRRRCGRCGTAGRASGPGRPVAVPGGRDPLRVATPRTALRAVRLPAQGPGPRRVDPHATRSTRSLPAAPCSTPRSPAGPDAAYTTAPPVLALSERERDVLGLIAEGRSNARSRIGWSCRSRPWRATSRTSSANSVCTTSPTTTAGSWPCSPPSAWTDPRVRRGRRDEVPRGQQQAGTRATPYVSDSRLFCPRSRSPVER